MQVRVFCHSTTGNTAKVAQAIAGAAGGPVRYRVPLQRRDRPDARHPVGCRLPASPVPFQSIGIPLAAQSAFTA